MDSTNCSSGTATDIFAIYDFENDKPFFKNCDVKLSAYWITIGFVMIFRLFVSFIDVLVFHELQLHRKQKFLPAQNVASKEHRSCSKEKSFVEMQPNQSYHQAMSITIGPLSDSKSREQARKADRRISWTMIADAFHVVIALISFLLIGFNVINALNGYTALFQALAFLTAHIQVVLTNIKLIHVSKRMVPRRLRDGADELERITVDKGLIFLFALAALAEVTGTVIAILAVTRSGETSDYFLFMLVSFCSAVVILILVSVRQTWRVTSYIHKMMSTPMNRSDDGRTSLKRTTLRLWNRQFVALSFTMSMLIVSILVATFTILMSWEIIVILFFIGTLAKLGSVVAINYGFLARWYTRKFGKRHNGTSSMKSMHPVT